MSGRSANPGPRRTRPAPFSNFKCMDDERMAGFSSGFQRGSEVCYPSCNDQLPRPRETSTDRQSAALSHCSASWWTMNTPYHARPCVSSRRTKGNISGVWPLCTKILLTDKYASIASVAIIQSKRTVLMHQGSTPSTTHFCANWESR
jgi:hypothetical protein